MKTLLAMTLGAGAGFLLGSRAGHGPYETVREVVSRRLDKAIDLTTTDMDAAMTDLAESQRDPVATAAYPTAVGVPS